MSTASSPAIQFDDVSVRFGARRVLGQFALTVDAGEMIAVTGPSGAGKSTILNLAGLLIAPDHGRIRLFGEPAPRPRSAAATKYLRTRIGYLFQNFALIDTDTVEANLRVALAYVPGRRQHSDRIADALAAVGLTGFQGRRVFELSGGEQQRVAIARLMLKPCDVVIADEPTATLDADNRDAVIALLGTLHTAGKTMLIATHDDAVTKVCDRVVRAGGEAAGFGGPLQEGHLARSMRATPIRPEPHRFAPTFSHRTE